MGSEDPNWDKYLTHAKALVRHIESGDHKEINRVMEDLVDIRESQLFLELGKLTRELHDALNGFRLDSRLADLAEKEVPDAKERLNHVINMTEESAHTTLNAVEETIPLSENMDREARNLQQEWQRFTDRKMSLEEFRQLSQNIDEFFSMISVSAGTIGTKLSEVLMAQGYQDLTGQIIRRVIQLVQDMETNLVEMIRISGISKKPNEYKESDDGQEQVHGPAVPGLDDTDTISSQDDVDELLSSLGF